MNLDELDKLLAIDVETTGPDPFTNKVLAIALIPFDQKIKPLSLFIRYDDGTELNWGSVAKEYFNNYKAEWEEYAISPYDAYLKIESYFREIPFDEAILVGHNVGFDFSFLKQLVSSVGKPPLKKLSHRSFDTHTLLYFFFLLGLIPREATSSTGAFSYFKISPEENLRHTAFADALATRELFRKLSLLLSQRMRE